jgi:hypothetical protein
VSGSCDHGNEPLGTVKGRKFCVSELCANLILQFCVVFFTSHLYTAVPFRLPVIHYTLSTVCKSHGKRGKLSKAFDTLVTVDIPVMVVTLDVHLANFSSSVSMLTRLRHGHPRSIPLHHRAQACSGPHPASCVVGTGSSLPRG